MEHNKFQNRRWTYGNGKKQEKQIRIWLHSDGAWHQNFSWSPKDVHCQFLKDIHHSVRINPKPQFQVNIHEPEEYRSRDEFLELFYTKYQESIDRNIAKQNKKKSELDTRFDAMKQRLQTYDSKINKQK